MAVAPEQSYLSRRIGKRYQQQLSAIQRTLFTDASDMQKWLRSRPTTPSPASCGVTSLTSPGIDLTIVVSTDAAIDFFPDVDPADWRIAISIAGHDRARDRARVLAPDVEADAWASLIVTPTWAPALLRNTTVVTGLNNTPTRWYCLLVDPTTGKARTTPPLSATPDWAPLSLPFSPPSAQ